MQEFQSIPGLAGRLFGGAAAAADLRRAQAQQQGPGGARCGGVSPAPEAVKCPRCDSTNTKFCYYNNYNLSQPRHFCKSCRRYWTKGGVLRNVPVGGGCRKAKRSSSSSASTTTTTTSSSSGPSTPTSAADGKNPRRASASSPRSNSGSGSGSGSASPTAAATTAPTPTTPATPSSNSVGLTSHHHHMNPFSTVDVAPPAPIFADQAAALASLFAPPPLPAFTFTAQPKEESATASCSAMQQLAGHAAPSEAPSSSASTTDMTPFASLDTSGMMFDLGGDASAAAYWSAGSCWTDVVHDPSLYLP